MTNVDSILKSRDIILPTKVHLVKAMVFPVVMYGCDSWTVKKAEHRKTDAFELCVGEAMPLLFNMLSRLVITFLPRNKRLLISWLQSPSPVILEPPKIKSDTVSTVSPSISHEVMGPDAMIFVF